MKDETMSVSWVMSAKNKERSDVLAASQALSFLQLYQFLRISTAGSFIFSPAVLAT